MNQPLGWRKLEGRGQGLGTNHRLCGGWRSLLIPAPEGGAYRVHSRLFGGGGCLHGDAVVLHVQRALRVRRDLAVPAAFVTTHRAYEDLAFDDHDPDDRAVLWGIIVPAGLDAHFLGLVEEPEGFLTER